MKKILFAVLLAVAAWPALAQETETQTQSEQQSKTVTDCGCEVDCKKYAEFLRQEERFKKIESKMAFEGLTRYAIGTNQKYGAIDLEIAYGYRPGKRWLINLPLTATAGLLRLDGARTYELNGAVGLGVGYNLGKNPEKCLQLVARGGVSLWNNDWRYTYYDLALRQDGSGIGVRYYNAYKGPFKSCISIYLTIGICRF